MNGNMKENLTKIHRTMTRLIIRVRCSGERLKSKLLANPIARMLFFEALNTIASIILQAMLFSNAAALS